MTDDQWIWFAGQGGEYFSSGPHATREEAIEAGRGEWGSEAFEIIEATQPPLKLSDWFDVDRALEDAEESLSDSDRYCDEFDHGPVFEIKTDQEKDLRERIAKAIDEWQAAHSLVFTVHTFASSRNHETIPATEEVPA